MSRSMVWHFVRKDIRLNCGLTVSSVLVGLLALALSRFGDAAGYAGLILLITAVIIQGVFICMGSIVAERKEKALLFALSFPISTGQYTAAKLIAAITNFVVPWGIIATGALLMLYISSVQHGLVPVAVLAWIFLFDQFFLILGITICKESDAWHSATIIWISTSISFFFYFILRVPSIHSTMNGSAAVWSTAVFVILAVEIGFAALVAALVAWHLTRQRDFI